MQLGGAPEVTARPHNTFPPTAVAPAGRARPRGRPRAGGSRILQAAAALLLAAAAALGPAACGGGGSPSAQALLNETFTSHQPIESGRIDLSFGLSTGGSGGGSARAGAFSLGLSGPFQSIGVGRFPRFALQLTLNTSGQTLKLGAISTPGELFLELAGVPFRTPASTLRALEQGYAQASSSSSSAGRAAFATLGVDPGRWLTHPAIAGQVRLAGVEVTHIVAGVDLARFLADAEKLSSAGGALGLGGAGEGGSGPLSPSGLSALVGSMRSARIELFTGAQDHLLRRLALSAEVSAAPAARAALGGLSSGTLSFVLQFTDVNRPQAIALPSSPQPLSQLAPLLRRLGLIGARRPGG